LLSPNLLVNENPEYGTIKQTSIIIESTPIQRIFALERSEGSRNLYAGIPSIGSGDLDSCEEEFEVHNYLSRAINMADEGSKGNRREAWKKVLSDTQVLP